MKDLIDRQEAIDAVLSVIPYDEYWKEQIEKAVGNLPSTQPERKTGRWIDDHCSECGQYVFRGDARNFCPNCGAKMLKEGEG